MKDFYLASSEHKLDVLLQLVSDEVKKAVKDVTEENRLYMLEDARKSQEQYNNLIERFKKQEENVDALKEELKKRDEYIKNIEKLLREQGEQLTKSTQKTKDEIMAAVTKKKRIWPFG